MVHWLLIWMLLLAFISYQKGAVTARESGGSHARCGSGKVNYLNVDRHTGLTGRLLLGLLWVGLENNVLCAPI